MLESTAHVEKESNIANRFIKQTEMETSTIDLVKWLKFYAFSNTSFKTVCVLLVV